MSHKERQYTSKISEGQWKRLKWLLPKRKGAGCPIELNLPSVINAILYVLVTQVVSGTKKYPNPNSVYYHFGKWSKDGTWQRLNRALVFLERRRVRRFACPSAAIYTPTSGISSNVGD